MESKHRERSRALVAAADERPAGRFVFVLLCVTPVASTLAFGAVDVWALGLLALLMTVLILGWFGGALQRNEFSVSTHPIQLPLLALLFIGVIQLIPFWSSEIPPDLLSGSFRQSITLDPYATRLFLVRLCIQIVFLAAALTFIVSRRRKKVVGILLVIFGALMAFFGILQRSTNPESIYGLRVTPQAIPFGPFVNQHHFAAMMEMTSGLAIGMLFSRATGRDQKLLLAAAASMMAIAILFTGSRGGLISYLAVVAFTTIASLTAERSGTDAASVRHRVVILAGSIALVMIAIGSVTFLGGGEGLLRGVGIDSAADITSGRGHFWSIALSIFLDHPVFGAGLDAFGVAFSRYDTWNGIYRVEQAHNDYLQTLADSGILGFACLAAFIFLLVREGMRAIADQTDVLRRSISLGALAGCIGILVHSFFDFPLRTPSNSFIFLLLVALVIATKQRRHHRA